MKVLITGITGFAGSHLADYLLAAQSEVEVHGTYRWRSRMEHIEAVQDRLHLEESDLRDYSSIQAGIAAVRPTYIFHLAAQSFVPTSWNAPAETLATNISGQANLFEAVRDLGLDPVIQIACSSEEYGLVRPDEVPIKETNPFRPLSPYAVSKVAQDLLAYQYHRSYGLRTIRTRAFNRVGKNRDTASTEICLSLRVATIAPIMPTHNTPTRNIGSAHRMAPSKRLRRRIWVAERMTMAARIRTRR
ncbi:MAG: GDP-mannose 4,6-dehydratase, partial [Rhodothermales bacterium]|nr:GDP-mannose 4,6-dehydratase [Rhodothermales bacterium]